MVAHHVGKPVFQPGRELEPAGRGSVSHRVQSDIGKSIPAHRAGRQQLQRRIRIRSGRAVHLRVGRNRRRRIIHARPGQDDVGLGRADLVGPGQFDPLLGQEFNAGDHRAGWDYQRLNNLGQERLARMTDRRAAFQIDNVVAVVRGENQTLSLELGRPGDCPCHQGQGHGNEQNQQPFHEYSFSPSGDNIIIEPGIALVNCGDSNQRRCKSGDNFGLE